MATAETSKHGDPWFEDGNLIIVVDGADVAFRVHCGVLSRHSEVFRSMFQLPQPESLVDLETISGCQVVRMFDLPWDLSNLIKGLYDGLTLSNHATSHFFYVASILRLATKYCVPQLRNACIAQLTATWPLTLAGHDDMVYLALNAPAQNDLTYPYVHPLHVLRVARETHVSTILPSVIYVLSLYPLTDLLKADHPKLTVDHPSKPSTELSFEDLKDYTLMYQHRIDVTLDFMRNFTRKRIASPGCLKLKPGCVPSTDVPCSKSFVTLASRLSRSWTSRTGPLHFMLQATKELRSSVDGISICVVCREAYHTDVQRLRQDIWNGLPAILGLPSWEKLQENATSPVV